MGALQCWGDSASAKTTVPTLTGSTWASVSAGGFHTCALTTAAAVRCWGDNTLGQRDVPKVTGGTWAGVSAGANHTCAITPAGTVVCWGSDASGETRVPSPTSGVFASVVGGSEFTCAFTTTGRVQCWGRNTSGQRLPPRGLGTVGRALAVETTAQLDAGDDHACALATTGTLRCWGNNGNGQTTVPASASGTFASVSAGNQHTCALTTTGVVQCWGDNTYDQSTPPPSPQRFAASSAATPDLTLAFANGSGSAPSVTASVRPGQAYASATAPVRRLWTVTATGGTPGWTARVRLYYRDDELPAGTDEATLALGKTEDDGVTWQPLTIVDRSTSENWVEADVTSFSTFMLVGAGGVLPVELTAFTATADGRTARLVWTTASETNNAGFTVERQTANGAWADASSLIVGHGTTTERHAYTFDVAGLTAGTHTFRLRQSDTDGALHHSAVVTVEIGTSGQTLVTLLGNGSRAPRLRVESEGGESVRAEVYDVLGRRVSLLLDGGTAVTGTVEAPFGVLTPGTYLVRVAAGMRTTGHTAVVR